MRKEEQEIRFKYLTNCAVFIEWGTEKILVDSIFSGRQPFDIMDSGLEDDILMGNGIFSEIRYVLVTHCHNDHYNGSKLLKFLEHHPGATVFLPVNARLNPEIMEKVHAKTVIMDSPFGQIKRVDCGAFQVEYMRTGHLTYNYPQHYCLNLVSEKSNMLITADMDLDHMELLKNFTKRESSRIFANAIMLWHRKWRRQLLELDYTHILFYHVASEERDILGYRKKTMVYWKKYKDTVSNWTLLGEETK